jgi:hypothetical protein
MVQRTTTMLWDHYPQLPYRAQVPWPKIYTRGNLDWVAGVDMVERWLDHSVGRHWCEWCWNMWALNQSSVCGVSFRWEKSVTLFLLRFGSGIEQDLE